MGANLEEYLSLLSADDDKVRKSAVRSIAAIPGDAATTALEEAAQDDNPGVRFLAKNALKKRKAGVIITTATSVEEESDTKADRPTKSAKRERARISTAPTPKAKTSHVSRRPSQAQEPDAPPPMASPPPAKVKPIKAVAPVGMSTDLAPLKALSFGELISKTFGTYQQLSWQACAVLAVVNTPVAAFLAFSFLLLLIAPTPQSAAGAVVLLKLLSIPFQMFAGWFGPAVMTKLVADNICGKKTELWGAFSFCWENIWTLISAAFVAWILTLTGTLVGSVAFVIPGLIFFIWASISWLFVPIVAVIEEKGSYSACERSAQLVGYSWGSVFGTLFCLGVVVGLISLVITGPAQLLSAASHNPGFRMVLEGSANLLASVLFTPLLSIGTVLLYFSQRVEYEGFDIEDMTRQLKG